MFTPPGSLIDKQQSQQANYVLIPIMIIYKSLFTACQFETKVISAPNMPRIFSFHNTLATKTLHFSNQNRKQNLAKNPRFLR